MDRQESVFDIISSTEHRDVPILLSLGNWRIIPNKTYGFVVRNTIGKEEYHFHADSNGWITGKNTNDIVNPQASSFNSNGTKVGCPVFVDEESTRNQEEILELRNKPELTFEEQKQLLELTGVRK